MKLRFVFAAAMLALCVSAPAASAQENSASPWTQQPTYQEKALHKLDFGLKNAFYGWTEMIEEPWATWKNKDGCMVKAKLRGFAYAVEDTLGGVFHVATFPVTAWDLKLPQNGVES